MRLSLEHTSKNSKTLSTKASESFPVSSKYYYRSTQCFIWNPFVPNTPLRGVRTFVSLRRMDSARNWHIRRIRLLHQLKAASTLFRWRPDRQNRARKRSEECAADWSKEACSGCSLGGSALQHIPRWRTFHSMWFPYDPKHLATVAEFLLDKHAESRNLWDFRHVKSRSHR